MTWLKLSRRVHADADDLGVGHLYPVFCRD